MDSTLFVLAILSRIGREAAALRAVLDKIANTNNRVHAIKAALRSVIDLVRILTNHLPRAQL